MKQLIYTIRIIYKSGATIDFDVTDFKISGDNWTWTSVPLTEDGKPTLGASPVRPIRLNPDEVAAAWQVNSRSVYKFELPWWLKWIAWWK